MEKKTNDSQVIVITSGKGGVGKTTAVANISTGLASRDYKVAVIDLDIGLKKLDLILGLENRVIYDIVGVYETSLQTFMHDLIRAAGVHADPADRATHHFERPRIFPGRVVRTGNDDPAARLRTTQHGS